MTSIGCRVGPDRGGLRDTVPPFVAGGKPPTHVRIMASSAQSAVTRDPSAVDDAVTLPRYGLRSARWRLMALSLVRRWVCAERRRPPLHCEWVLPECGCREGAVLTYPFKVKSLRRVWAIPTTAAGRPSIAAGRPQRGDAPVPQRRRPRRHALGMPEFGAQTIGPKRVGRSHRLSRWPQTIWAGSMRLPCVI